MADYISREAAIKAAKCHYPKANEMIAGIILVPAADVRPVPPGGIGEMSDGYHTFNGLYYQRMVVFAALVRQNRDRSWKSWKHEDGELCFGGGWFIVGIDTPQGTYTYHYEAKDFDLFDCEELPVAKHWDGHTEKDATRLLSLDVRPVVHEPDDRERICLHAINHFGVEHQKWKLVEELGELLVEIAREHIGRGNKDAIREELADANIMCRQMRIVYGAAKVDGWIRRKLERLVDRMNEEGPDGGE